MDDGYMKLEVYKLSHSLALRVHKMTLTLPKFEWYEEGGQIRRSSKSVSAQIVEGYALRKYKAEFLHYLWRAYGSSEETVEHLRFLYESESLKDQELYSDLSEGYKLLNRMLFNYILSVEKTHETPAFLKEPFGEYSPDDLNPEP
jgi:four helix bundle protein